MSYTPHPPPSFPASDPSIQCDRKRPCSRCIQLGLVCLDYIRASLLTLIHRYYQTGLCVYEVDDPAIRDDPNVDEVTKLRNRIAELESLVRELRGNIISRSLPLLPLTRVLHQGKPHPRWVDNGANQTPAADANDLSEKWHTRAFKKPAGAGSQQLTIKTEPEHSSDYLSPHRRPGMYTHTSHNGHYSPSPPLSVDGSSSSSPTRLDHDQSYYTLNPNSTSTTTGLSCRCLSNPSVTSQLSSLTRTLHATHGFLNRTVEHNPEGCVVIDRIADLNNLLL